MNIEPIAIDAATETRAAFTIAARPLADAVKLLSGKVTEKRNAIPILSMLLIEAAPCGRVTLTATDLDIMATVTLQADPSEEIEPGALCLDAYALSQMLAKVAKNSERVRIQAQDSNRANLKAGRNVYKLPGLPRDDFPMIPARELDCAGVIDRAQFLADLKALAPAVSTEESRYYLNGYALQVRELGGADRFAIVATNGGNMAAASRPIPVGLEAWDDAILSRKTGAVLLAADKVAGEGEGVTLSRFGAVIGLEFGAVRIVSKLIDGTFPNWQRAFAGACIPTEATEDALFPDMMPGRPLAAMEGLAKAAPVPISWAESLGAFIGESPDDAGLAWCSNKLASDNEPRKGYRYSDGESRDHARAYLKALAEGQGLPGALSFAEKCQPFNEARAQSSARGMNSLQTDGDRVLGLTVGGEVTHWGRWETVKDWEALCDRQIWIEPRTEMLAGSYSVLMPADGPVIEHDYSVTVEGDRTYPVAVNANATQIHLSKEQVQALCGYDLWNVLEFPGHDGKPRYVSQWLWDDGATRLLCVGKDGRCPKAGAVREYVTRAEVEAALAGEIAAPVMIEARAPAEPITVAPEAVSAPETAPVCDAAAPCATHAAEMPEIAPVAAPAEAEAAMRDNGDPIAAVRARLAEIEALLATLPAQSARPKRTPAHERMIRRAWAERRAARAARFNVELARDMSANNKRMAEYQRDRADAAEAERDKAMEAYNASGDERRALVKDRDDWQGRAQRADDARRLAESIAEDHMRMRDDMQRVLVAVEARLADAESENAQLWAEIETLTAPVPALAA